ncbi:MAG: hypothetical protein RR657_07105 [Peptostreptococcaceae bacterium]
MKEFKTVIDLTCNLHLIPGTVALDVLKRIVDWMLTPGTSVEDDYIKRQLFYASKFLSK